MEHRDRDKRATSGEQLHYKLHVAVENPLNYTDLSFMYQYKPAYFSPVHVRLILDLMELFGKRKCYNCMGEQLCIHNMTLALKPGVQLGLILFSLHPLSTAHIG